MGDFAELWRAVVLGLVQAATEFLPISSSGHLVLAPELIGDEISSLTFDVALHLGTMVAVIAFFWRDWLRIIGSGLVDIVRHGARLNQWDPYSLLGLCIVLGTIPSVVVGLLFKDAIEGNLREPWLVGTMLIGFGVLMGSLDRWGGTVGQLLGVTPGRAVIIGVAQAMALVPGVSRAGVTITAARGLGFDRAAAARFSFLLSAPAVLGAGVLQFSEALASDEMLNWGPLMLGAFVSAVAGTLVIRWLLSFLKSGTLWPFVWYRIALGLVVLVATAVGLL